MGAPLANKPQKLLVLTQQAFLSKAQGGHEHNA